LKLMHVVLLMDCYAMLWSRRQAAFERLVPVPSGAGQLHQSALWAVHIRKNSSAVRRACSKRLLPTLSIRETS